MTPRPPLQIMAPTVGSRLGHSDVTASLGEDGMGHSDLIRGTQHARPGPMAMFLHDGVSVARRTFGVLVVVLGVTPLAAMGDDPAGEIVGVWDTGDGAHVEVYERAGKYHGRFIRFDDEPPAGGLDAQNPDPTLRDRRLLGTDFIRNFEFVGNKWRNGRIYNPENGKQYKADLELQDGVLKVRGWIGIRLLGRTVEWTRTD